MIPAGINAAALALATIGQVRVEYRRFTGRTTNTIGLDVATYADPVPATGSWQPVPRDVYEALGLDLQKQHVTWITRAFLADIDRDTSGDIVERAGRHYQVLSATTWEMDCGYSSYLLVRLPAEATP